MSGAIHNSSVGQCTRWDRALYNDACTEQGHGMVALWVRVVQRSAGCYGAWTHTHGSIRQWHVRTTCWYVWRCMAACIEPPSSISTCSLTTAHCCLMWLRGELAAGTAESHLPHIPVTSSHLSHPFQLVDVYEHAGSPLPYTRKVSTHDCTGHLFICFIVCCSSALHGHLPVNGGWPQGSSEACLCPHRMYDV